MALGELIGKVTSMFGGAAAGEFDLAAKLGEIGVDASMLEGLDLEAAKSFIDEKGFDLSMLDSLGLNIDDLLAKFMGGDAAE